jgi:hypothetical protein
LSNRSKTTQAELHNVATKGQAADLAATIRFVGTNSTGWKPDNTGARVSILDKDGDGNVFDGATVDDSLAGRSEGDSVCSVTSFGVFEGMDELAACGAALGDIIGEKAGQSLHY